MKFLVKLGLLPCSLNFRVLGALSGSTYLISFT